MARLGRLDLLEIRSADWGEAEVPGIGSERELLTGADFVRTEIPQRSSLLPY
jgi:hypothetical protein